MRINIFKPLAFTGLLAITFSACQKDKDPVLPPVEQEVITTVKITFVDNVDSTKRTFTYKVENGFGNTQQGNVSIDTINLLASSLYLTEVRLYNEKVDPAEDVTEEVISENTEHLFLYSSDPAEGAGSMTSSDGNLDKDGKPFNQTVSFVTGEAGPGLLTIHLMHQPTDKTATTPEAAGGETDVDVTFPVVIK